MKKSILCLAFIAACAAFGPAASAAEPAAPAAPPAPSEAPAVNAVPVSRTYMDSLVRAERAQRPSMPGPRGPQRIRGDAPERKAPPAFRHRRDGRWDGPRHHRDDCPYYDEEYDENGYCIAHHGRHHRDGHHGGWHC